MGWFSRTPKPGKPPRWGFTDEWELFVERLTAIAAQWNLTLTAKQIEKGRVDLPEDAAYDYWDLAPLGARCRDLAPHKRGEAIYADLVEMFGRTHDNAEVEVVDGAPPATAHAANADLTDDEIDDMMSSDDGIERVLNAKMPAPQPREASVLEADLRAQIFGGIYFSILDHDKIACRKIGDAWLAIVQETPGGESTLTHGQLKSIGHDFDSALTIAIAQGLGRVRAMQRNKLAVPGAKIELYVSNDFFMSALMMSPQKPETLAGDIKCPITWHHWLVADLEPGATVETIKAIQDLVTELGEKLAVAHMEWIGTSLWWWPPDSEPTPFTLETLPPALASQLAT
ncbi:MAG: hypothetical protein QM831_38365 [Kofleriaceae bacterium]